MGDLKKCLVFLTLLFSISYGDQEVLVALPDPTIIASSPSAVWGPYGVENIFDDNLSTFYVSGGYGDDTFIDFDFGVPTTIAGSMNVAGPDFTLMTIEAALIFSNNSDFSSPIATVSL